MQISTNYFTIQTTTHNLRKEAQERAERRAIWSQRASKYTMQFGVLVSLCAILWFNAPSFVDAVAYDGNIVYASDTATQQDINLAIDASKK